jgi:hypothetical protein
VLAGCGATPELASGRAAELQADVLAVTEAVAAGQYDVAAEALAAVRAGAQEAVDAGEVSTTRYHQIDEALDRTAAELEAARVALAEQQAAEQAAAEQAAAEQAAAEQAAAEQAAAEQAAAEQAAAEQAAAEQAANQGKAGDEKDANDKGGGNGKGRDKD